MNALPNQILVTGAGGWLGSRLVEILLHGLTEVPGLTFPPIEGRIRCLVWPGENSNRLPVSDRIETISGDLRRPEDCERFCQQSRGAILFHTAGIIHPKRVQDLYDVNVRGTANLLQAASRAGVRRVVVISSNSPCGCNPHPDHLFDELSPYRPYLNYGRSKMQMEILVQEFQQRGELETVILRPPWFYGPNQPVRQTLFFRMIRDGKAPIVGSGENLRSMCYVDNLCQGLLLAAQVERAVGRTYWIADRRPYSMNQIIDTIERLMEQEFGQKCRHRRLRLPGLASAVAFAADSLLQAAGVYHQKIHVLSEMNKSIACSIGTAEKELGYRPHIELEEGMRRSLAWCRAQGISI